MAAIHFLEAFTAELSAREREELKDLIDNVRRDLLVARSEEARVRIVSNFIKESRYSFEGGVTRPIGL